MFEVTQTDDAQLFCLYLELSASERQRAARIGEMDARKVYPGFDNLSPEQATDVRRVSLLLAFCEVTPSDITREKCKAMLITFDPRFVPGQETAWLELAVGGNDRDRRDPALNQNATWVWLKTAYLSRVHSREPFG